MESEKGSFSRLKGRCERGKLAEDMALEYLLKRGLTLLKRNYRAGHREIDLIMKSGHFDLKNEMIHIVEVRSLSEPLVKLPFETVDRKKQRAVISAAARFIFRNNIHFDTRFDIVSVIFKVGGLVEIKYFPDAFAPEW